MVLTSSSSASKTVLEACEILFLYSKVKIAFLYFFTEDCESGYQRAEGLIKRCEKDFPRAMSSFKDDLDATLAHLYLPAVHRKNVRTTNLIERSFGEEKRRSKVIPRFFNEKSALKLAFATLWRTSQNWRKVRFSEIEQKHVLELRKKLGLVVEETVNTDEDQEKDGSAA